MQKERLSNRELLFLLLSCFFSLSLFCFSTAVAADDVAITVYGAQLSTDTLGDTLISNAHYKNSYVGVVAVSKKVMSFRKLINIEVEGQVGKHFGLQDNWEFNALPIVIRWLPFPWDAHVDTSFALGAGLSYASSTPKLEAIGADHNPRLLGYLMGELTFSLPNNSKWDFVLRLHHRSGAFKLIGNRYDVSNAVGAGIKYRF